ncbi:short-chain dehydrogenase [Streptomyces spinoverrucosus]|uniref:Short-chain dehydrogenase n=1 Tax=Streptomyces spinoverrucosus TaxID=284043 RepID=A0A4Y3VS06_9ACTN|nr:SDR family oxidoreductase [Streptomyces spinoverrucosus]GEC09637.1 short-chain dehydrogenase [Streptomyces spinoverrucosus]GHB70541.1 short-chain dehydrogenase [Streptomyces spinoverrucosus]
MRRIDYRHQTVIVTGASSGLGAEFARQLAARRSNLVLVARRADRLQNLADDLTRTHGVTVTVVARDLGLPDAGRTLRAELESRGIHATGLVNNAGFGSHDPFRDENPERLQSMIALNVAALVDLSHAYIDPLTSAGNGFLINVASILGYQPTPYLSVYGATKAFVLSFTESLWEETRGTGLRVLAVCPGAVETEFYDAAGSQSADYGSKRATVDHVVKTALDTLDRRSAPPSVITNGRPLALASKVLPRRLVVSAMGWMARRAMHA